MPILDEPVFIHVKWPRFICTDCDNNPTSSFHPDWLSDTGTITKDYEEFFLKMLINSTIKDVAIKFDTTEEILQGILNRQISTYIDWSKVNPSRIGVDEIALRKGHSHYLTIISDISKGEKVKIIGVLDGRTKDVVIPFFRSIPRKTLHDLESICTDMGAGFLASIKEVISDDHKFNEIVTVDRFHVAKLIGTAVDNERKRIMKKLKIKYAEDETVLEILKDTMWPFRQHPSDLTHVQQEKLDNLFEYSSYLEQCYQLREELYLIFESKYSKDDARKQIRLWSINALECVNNEKQSPFTSFIKTYLKFEDNILNYFNLRASSGPVEGLNNKIKMIKRRGFGFRNVLQFAQRLFLDINYKFELLPNCY
jgi:transposase